MAKNRYVEGLLKPLGNFIGAQTNGQSDTIDKVMPVWQFYKVAQNIFVNYFSEITFYQQSNHTEQIDRKQSFSTKIASQRL